MQSSEFIVPSNVDSTIYNVIQKYVLENTESCKNIKRGIFFIYITDNKNTNPQIRYVMDICLK